MSEKFEFLAKIGEGAFATVFKVKRKQDSKLYAFKKMKTISMSDKELSLTLNQIRILASVKSPYIIQYKETFYDENLKSLCLVTELAQGGDLSIKINSIKKAKGFIPQQFIWKTMLNLIHGIKALHSMKIVHRDIKPANVLLTKNQQCVKLADMNVSVISKTGMAITQTGTPAYASPQVWMQKPYSGKSDIWSLGCLIYEMAALKPPFTAFDIQTLKKCIISKEPEGLPSRYSKELQSLVKLCLQKNQNLRPSASQLLNMSIIKQKSKQHPEQKYNQPYFPLIDRGCTMINTIRLDKNNFKSLQNKLPRCNYSGNIDKADKQNVNISNLSTKAQHNAGLAKDNKLPAITRPQSVGKKNQRVYELINRVQVIKKLR